MSHRIGNLINNLQLEAEKIPQAAPLQSSSVLRLLTSNALEYDSDTIRKLLITDHSNSPESAGLKSQLHNVSRQISEQQFAAKSALVHLQRQKLQAQSQAGQDKGTAQHQEEEAHDQRFQKKPSPGLGEETVSATSSFAKGEEKEGDLTELRNRLLSRKSSSFATSNQSMENQNEMHQVKQDTLLNDMLGLVSHLKQNVAKFNESVENDTAILSSTTQHLEKVGGAANLIGKRLKVFNEQGKIGFWFYVYVLVALVVIPVLMLLIIRLIPRGIF